jgi:hypothetical protein
VNLVAGIIDRLERKNEVTFKNCCLDVSSFALAAQIVGLVILDSGVAASLTSIVPSR